MKFAYFYDDPDCTRVVDDTHTKKWIRINSFHEELNLFHSGWSNEIRCFWIPIGCEVTIYDSLMWGPSPRTIKGTEEYTTLVGGYKGEKWDKEINHVKVKCLKGN